MLIVAVHIFKLGGDWYNVPVSKNEISFWYTVSIVCLLFIMTRTGLRPNGGMCGFWNK